MRRPRLLDLFCGAGGCARGYTEAGFAVTGVDIAEQPRYLMSGAKEFIRTDALEYLETHGREYDMIHASPPCQAYSVCANMPNGRPDHPDLVGMVRTALLTCGRPWVIENVTGAPLMNGSVVLCGLMFGLGVFRHRAFESSILLLVPPHPSHRGRRIGQGGMCCVAGHGGQGIGWNWNGSWQTVPADHRTASAWRRAMGIDWMTMAQLAQAIPPDYTRYIGRQLRRALGDTDMPRKPDPSAVPEGQHLLVPHALRCEGCNRQSKGRLISDGTKLLCRRCYAAPAEHEAKPRRTRR